MSASPRQKQRVFLIIGFTVLTYFASQYPTSPEIHAPKNESIESLIQQQKSNVRVTLTSIVFKVLKDDLKGSRHQRFLIQIGSGDTILIAHNIDLAPKIDSLQKGDTVTISGKYEWNDKGGVIHWTHHDPAGKHHAGWIDHNGRRYQ